MSYRENNKSLKNLKLVNKTLKTCYLTNNNVCQKEQKKFLLCENCIQGYYLSFMRAFFGHYRKGMGKMKLNKKYII